MLPLLSEDANGNLELNLHRGSGITLPITADEDISAATWKFHAQIPDNDVLTITLVANPDDLEGLKLVISQEEVAAIPEGGVPFFIHDEDNDLLKAEGTIFVRGFASE